MHVKTIGEAAAIARGFGQKASYILDVPEVYYYRVGMDGIY